MSAPEHSLPAECTRRRSSGSLVRSRSPRASTPTTTTASTMSSPRSLANTAPAARAWGSLSGSMRQSPQETRELCLGTRSHAWASASAAGQTPRSSSRRCSAQTDREPRSTAISAPVSVGDAAHAVVPGSHRVCARATLSDCSTPARPFAQPRHLAAQGPRAPHRQLTAPLFLPLCFGFRFLLALGLLLAGLLELRAPRDADRRGLMDHRTVLSGERGRHLQFAPTEVYIGGQR